MSITTVSRILNGRESGIPIREETRQRVLAVAAEMGYKPNLLARGLRGSRSSLLGVIARDISDPFHIQILRGINAAAQAARLPAVPRPRRLPAGRRADVRLDVRAVARGRDHHHRRHRRRATRRWRSSPSSTASCSGSPTGRRVARSRASTATASVGTRLALEHLWELGHRSDHLRVGRADLRRPAADRPVRAVHARARGRRPDPGPRLGAEPDPASSSAGGSSPTSTTRRRRRRSSRRRTRSRWV